MTVQTSTSTAKRATAPTMTSHQAIVPNIYARHPIDDALIVAEMQRRALCAPSPIPQEELEKVIAGVLADRRKMGL